MTLSLSARFALAPDEWAALGRAVGDAGGDPFECELRTTAAPTRAPAAVLRGTGEGGVPLELFVKRVGLHNRDHPDAEPRDREIRVYRELLSGVPEVPPCHGAVFDRATGQGLLVLGFVGRLTLAHATLRAWLVAAEAIGRLHLRFAGRFDQAAPPFLLELGISYFERWAEQARRAVETVAPPLAPQLEGVASAAAELHETAGGACATLVHNDLGRQNVVMPDVDGSSLAMVDWEFGAFGPAIHDVVHLVHRRLDPETERRFHQVYRQTVAGRGLVPDSAADYARAVAAARALRDLYRLAHADQWATPLAEVVSAVTRAGNSAREARS